MDSTNCRLKILLKKKFRKFKKTKLEFAAHTSNHLHSIFIVLGIISNLEIKYTGDYAMIICKYYTFLYKGYISEYFDICEVS